MEQRPRITRNSPQRSSLVQAVQGNFTHLMGLVKALVRAHNLLDDDVNELTDMVNGLSGVPEHAHDGEVDSGGPITVSVDHDDLTNVTPNQHHPEVHDHDADYDALGAAAAAEADAAAYTDAERADHEADFDHTLIGGGGVHDHDADYVQLDDPDYVDLTDGGETALHSHAGGGGNGHPVMVWNSKVEVAAGDVSAPFPAPFDLNFDEVYFALPSNNVGTTRVDFRVNGASVFTLDGDKPSVTAGQFSSREVPNAITGCVSGDELTFEIEQLGGAVGRIICVLVATEA